MSLAEEFPKRVDEIEREVGIADKDPSKPLLLRLLEQVKFGAPMSSNHASSFGGGPIAPPPRTEVVTFGSNNSSAFDDPMQPNSSFPDQNPDTFAKKDNSRKSKKDSKTKKSKAKKQAKNNADEMPAGSEMTKLDDLPSLGGPGQARGKFGGGRFGAVRQIEEEEDDGFNDFNFNDDVIGDSSNKFDNAEKYLQDHYQEESEGFKMSSDAKNKK